MAATTDRFGNPIDPTVGYARGTILRGTDEEVAKTLRARRLVRDRIEGDGVDSIYDLTGMNRVWAAPECRSPEKMRWTSRGSGATGATRPGWCPSKPIPSWPWTCPAQAASSRSPRSPFRAGAPGFR